MKTTALLLAFLSCSAGSGFSQGYVNFNNNGLLAGNPPSILVFNLDGSPLIGTNWVAQLYYGAPGSPESSLILVAGAPAHFRAPTTSLPGTWASGGTRTLDGFTEGEMVVLQVRVWDGSCFPTYEMASAAAGVTGKSVIFNYYVPPCHGAPDCWQMVNFHGFTLVAPMPLLSVTLSRNQNQLIRTWPTNFVGFTLQSSPALGSDAQWTDSTDAPVIAGNQYFLATSVTNAARFYRLKK